MATARAGQWTAEGTYQTGDLVVYAAQNRFDLYVATGSPVVGVPPPQASASWLEVDQYNGSWVANHAWARGHIVDRVRNGMRLWFIAQEPVSASDPPPGEEQRGEERWLLFGGGRAEIIPSVRPQPTLWRAERSYEGVPAGTALKLGPNIGDFILGALRVRVEPGPASPSTLDTFEGLVQLADIAALPATEPGTVLYTQRGHGISIAPGGGGFGTEPEMGRTGEGDLLLALTASSRWRDAYVMVVHEATWPEAVLAMLTGDVTINTEGPAPVASLAAGVVGREELADDQRLPDLAENAGKWVRVNADGTGYEAVSEAPTGDLPTARRAPDAADVAGFRAMFPEFAANDDLTVGLALAQATMAHQQTVMGTLFAAAHLLVTMADMTGRADGGDGIVKSEKIGPRSVTLEVLAGRGSDRERFWATSAYGRQFLEIEARTPRLVVTASVVG